MALVALSVGVTWVASGRIRSPAEAAARTLAPEPSPILVPVETRVIANDIVTRGTGRFGSPQVLTIAPTDLKVSSGYVDIAASVGSEIGDGGVAFVHSGRPTILLEGAQPAYRDLGPGMSGADVLQLEQALERLGFDPNGVDGSYDESTQMAVVAWYRSLGYEPVMTGITQLETIRSIEADMVSAQRDALAAQEGVASAQAEVVAAQGAWQSAVVGEGAAEQATIAAQLEATMAVRAAEAEAEVAALAAEQAWIQLPSEWTSAEEEQTVLFELSQLRSIEAAAQANVDLVRANGSASSGVAQSATAAAPGEVAVAAAAVSAAQQRREAALKTAALATASVDRLASDLTAAQARSGVHVPADEIIFVVDTPVRVAEVHVQRGSVAEGPMLSVTDAVVAVDGALALEQVALVKPGMVVQLSEPDLGIEAEAIVSFVATGPGTHGVDGFHVYFEALVTDSVTPAQNIVGASVRLTMSVESSGGPVLAVPGSAVTLAVDGSSQVLVQRRGELEPVTVEPGLAGAGYVQVTAVAGEGPLRDGELVVVGFELRVAGNG